MDATPRWGLPLLFAGQAQKEIFHNEALMLVDALLHGRVESADLGAPPTDPDSLTPAQKANELTLAFAEPTDSFELVFAFDEVITTGGYRETIDMRTIRQNLDMDSHEEKLANMVNNTVLRRSMAYSESSGVAGAAKRTSQ